MADISPKTGQVVVAVVTVLLMAGLWWLNTIGTGEDQGRVAEESGLPVVQVADLPPEARDTMRLIDDGGPFPHDEDGGTFQNREEILPDQPTGYYAEYTVETPGSDDRGARRIVAGDGGELYWTDDHYRSFSQIAR